MKLRKILLKRFIITAGVSILLTAVFQQPLSGLFFLLRKNNIKRLYKYSRKSL